MASDYTVKQHDTAPPLVTALADAAGSVDLTGATVRLLLKCTAPPVSVVGVCTLTDPVNGILQYNWAVGDCAVAGTYELEFEVTWPDATIETFPNDGYLTFTILPDLGP